MNSEAIRKELVKIGRLVSQKDLIVGPGGNISAKCGDVVFIKASGVAFEDAKMADYIPVRISDGKVLEKRKRPSSEILTHLECYKIRNDIGAVIHTHSPVATGIASAGISLKPMYPDFIVYVGTEVPTLNYVPPTGRELAKAVSKVIKKHNGVLLSNHGVFTVGTNLKETYYRALLIEEASKTFLAAVAVGKPRFLTKKQIQDIKNLEVEKYRIGLLKKQKIQ